MRLPPFVLVLACLWTVPTGVSVAQDARTELEAADRALGAAWSRRDLGALMAFYADSAVAMWTGEPLMRSREAIQAFMRRSWADPAYGVLTGDRHWFEMAASGDMAYMGGTSTFRRTVNGQEVVRPGGWMTIWRRIGGRWLIVSEVWNQRSEG